MAKEKDEKQIIIGEIFNTSPVKSTSQIYSRSNKPPSLVSPAISTAVREPKPLRTKIGIQFGSYSGNPILCEQKQLDSSPSWPSQNVTCK